MGSSPFKRGNDHSTFREQYGGCRFLNMSPKTRCCFSCSLSSGDMAGNVFILTPGNLMKPLFCDVERTAVAMVTVRSVASDSEPGV